MDRFAPGRGAGDGYRRFQKLSAQLHDVSNRFFFWKAVEDLFDTIDMRANLNPVDPARRDVAAHGQPRSPARSARASRTTRLAQMLDHFTQYVGSSPYGSPAVLCAIAHMQTAEGVWYPMGGTRAVAASLGEARGRARRARSGRASRSPDSIFPGERCGACAPRPARIFPSTPSSPTWTRSAPTGSSSAARRPPHYERKRFEPACSGVVLYLGLDRRYDHLAHHDFVFSRDPEEEFDFIYRRGEPAPDPTCYLAAPSITDPSVAPSGGEALYVLVHTPYLRPHHDWSRMLPDYRRVILDKLKRTAGLADLEERIVVERHLTPQDIHDRYKVLNGAIYGLASHGRFLGAFKPGNRSRHVRGLYLAGGAAHPGPGMPMVLMSGWIAADALDADAEGLRQVS